MLFFIDSAPASKIDSSKDIAAHMCNVILKMYFSRTLVIHLILSIAKLVRVQLPVSYELASYVACENSNKQWIIFLQSIC